MATITAKSTNGIREERYVLVTSDPADPTADTVEMVLPPGNPHYFLSVQMFDGAGDPVVASAGTFTVSVQTVNALAFEAIPTPTIDATAPSTVNWAGNTIVVRIVPTGVIGVVTFRAVFSGKRTPRRRRSKRSRGFSGVTAIGA